MEGIGFSQRLKDIWSDQLKDGYATALWVCLLVTIATTLAIKIDWKPLTELTMSVLDIKPMLFFLLCWCVVRIIELFGATLFARPVESGALANRLRKATAEAASVMFGAFFGVIAGLYIGTTAACAHASFELPLLVLLIAVLAPIAMATGAFDLTISGFSKIAASWLTVFAMFLFVIWTAYSVVKQESQPHKAVCPAQNASSVTSAH